MSKDILFRLKDLEKFLVDFSIYLRGREMIEVDFEGPRTLKIGRMRAFDYFGDGSFYLLDAPGHTMGHLCGLVRTTSSPDSFILLGADAVHDAGELRPSQFIPIPESIDLRQFLPQSVRTAVCPGHVLEDFQKSRGRKPDEPILQGNIAWDRQQMADTVEKLQHADADDDIFFIYAHDRSIMDVVPLFPKEATDWKAQGWAKKVKWAFLTEYWHALKLDQTSQ